MIIQGITMFEFVKIAEKYGLKLRRAAYDSERNLYYFSVQEKGRKYKKRENDGWFSISLSDNKKELDLYQIELKRTRQGVGTRIVKSLKEYAETKNLEMINFIRYTNDLEAADKISERTGLELLTENLPTISFKI
jgi:hypothetical protein